MNRFLRSGVIAAALLVSAVGPLLSQYDYQKFTGKPNPGLREKIRKGAVGDLFAKWCVDGAAEAFSTSFLAAQGKAPAVDPDDPDSIFRYLAWQGMYCASSVTDGNAKTAWVEGVQGDGLHEIVIARVNTRKPVRIWSGYGKSAATFANNARPKKVRVFVLTGRKDADRCTESGEMLANLCVAARADAVLKEKNGYQPLPIPKHTLKATEDVTLIAVEILAVYPGKKYRDTCISEIGN